MINIECIVCGKEKKVKPSAVLRGRKFCSITCRNISYRGSGNPKWRGGIYNANGYLYIYSPNHPFKNKDGHVMQHRLVMEKKLGRYLKPKEICDHINGIRTDNRISNLRLVNNSQNGMNKCIQKNNKCGYKGVYLNKKSLKFNAEIRASGKRFYLGTFTKPEDAALAYNKAALEYHKQYARLNIL